MLAARGGMSMSAPQPTFPSGVYRIELLYLRPMIDGGNRALACVLSSFLAVIGARASVPGASGSPYQGIMDRNIFGLKPPPAPPRPEDIKPPVPIVVTS